MALGYMRLGILLFMVIHSDRSSSDHEVGCQKILR
jgi:hypothetical protein